MPGKNLLTINIESMSMNNDLPKYKLMYVNDGFTREPFEGIDKVAQDIGEGFLVLWQHHGVFVRKINKGVVEWLRNEAIEEDMTEHLIRLRAFSEGRKCEYHFWRTTQINNGTRKNVINGRKRIDKTIITLGEYKSKTDGEKEKLIPFIETKMVIRGVIVEQLINVINKFEKPEKGNKLCVTTHNYIGYNDIGQASYVDSRFVDFI